MLSPDNEDQQPLTVDTNKALPETTRPPACNDANNVKQLLEDLQAICRRLEDIGEDALILYTGAQHVLGTPVATTFVQQSASILTKFQQFCKDKKNKTADVHKISNDVAGKTDVANSLSVDEFINSPKPESFPMFDDCDEDTNEYDDCIVAGKVEPSKELKEVKIEVMNMSKNEIKKWSGKRHKDATNDVTLTAIKKRPKRQCLTKATKKHEQSNNTSEKKPIIKDDNTEQTKSLEIPAKVFVDDIEIVTAEEARIDANGDQNKSGKYNCYKCNKELNLLGRLREHLTKVHKIKIGHKCVCEKFFSDDLSFETHKKSAKYKNTHHKCEQCENVLRSEIALKMHVKEEHEEEESIEMEDFGEYPCEKCKTVFIHKQHLISHNKKVLNCDQEAGESNDIDEKAFEQGTITYRETEDGDDITKTYKELTENQKKCPWKCVICKKLYNRKSNFTRHMILHIDGGSYLCNICGLRFKTKESLSRHGKQHFSKPYSCDYCRQRFRTELELDDHNKFQCKSGDRENCRCDICGQKLQSVAALMAHQNMHAGIKPFTCEVCGKSVTSNSSLERHMISMHQEETHFECETCQKRFKTKDNYKKHLKTHQEPKYHCEICGKGCVELGNLKKHMMSHTKEKPFVCELCGKAYGRKSLLDNHRRLHTGEKPFKCTKEDCDKRFRSYSNLKQHIRSHSTTNPYVCDVCGKSFKQPGRLHYHRKDHFIENRWPCAYCSSKFKSVFIYKNHLAKVHPEMKKEVEEKSNIRLYQCDLCHKMYGDKEDLTRHIFIHQGIKPYKCQYCSKAFNDKSNLKQHEKIHTGDKRFQCEICPKAFIHNKTMRLHVRNCHEKPQRIARPPKAKVKTEKVRDTVSPGQVVNEPGYDISIAPVDPADNIENAKVVRMTNRAGTEMLYPDSMGNKEPVQMGNKGSLETKKVRESSRVQLVDGTQLQAMENDKAEEIVFIHGDPRRVVQQQPYILQAHEIPLHNIPVGAVNSLTGQIEPLLIIENF